MRDFLSSRAIILEAEILALVASGAKELARPRESAVNTTAANTLRGEQKLVSTPKYPFQWNFASKHLNGSYLDWKLRMIIREIFYYTFTDWNMSSKAARFSMTRKAPKLKPAA